MFNFQIFLLQSTFDNVKETRSVDGETFCYTISKSWTSILPCREMIIHLLFNHLALNISVVLLQSPGSILSNKICVSRSENASQKDDFEKYLHCMIDCVKVQSHLLFLIWPIWNLFLHHLEQLFGWGQFQNIFGTY